MMMTGAPIKLTQADAADVADLYNRCSDYFLLQDGAAPTLDDARELFSDVPPEKSAHNQAVLGWKGPGGLYAIAAILRDYPRDGTWGSVAKIVKLEHAWRRLDGRNDDGFQVAPFPG
ncbi:hypothetical protein [Sphingobium indicum]|uniref:hypothetical protein n=1 Tax=Sphingobium indicum TaxID=332055 RepID=UPI0011DF8A44|nr:hypothetical protein [Sphingobium indicum]